MIDHLRMMAIFQTVAESGSFRQAAKILNLSPSVVSHHVSQLEDQLGQPLLYRSTRRMSLTDAGRDLLAASQRMTRAAQEGLAALQRRTERPVGTLSITASTAVAHRPYVDAYVQFARAYPGVTLSMHITDHSVKLEGSRFDVAIRGRINDLDDSAYKARKLGVIQRCIFASPDYLRDRPTPKTLDDLSGMTQVVNPQVPWREMTANENGLEAGEEPQVVLTCDNYTMARRFVDDGLAFMIETYPLVSDDFRSGKLVQLLPNIRLRPIEVYAVYPANSPRDSLARQFVDFLVEQYRAGVQGFALS